MTSLTLNRHQKNKNQSHKQKTKTIKKIISFSRNKVRNKKKLLLTSGYTCNVMIF